MSKNNILIGSILGDGNILIGTKYNGIIPTTTTTTTSTTTTTTIAPTTTTTTTTIGPFNITADILWSGPVGYGVAGTICLRCCNGTGISGYTTPGIVGSDTAFFNNVPAGTYYVDFSDVGAWCISPPVQVSNSFCWIDYFANCANVYTTDCFSVTNWICSCHMP